jgi:hypothetical protein
MKCQNATDKIKLDDSALKTIYDFEVNVLPNLAGFMAESPDEDDFRSEKKGKKKDKKKKGKKKDKKKEFKKRRWN